MLIPFQQQHRIQFIGDPPKFCDDIVLAKVWPVCNRRAWLSSKCKCDPQHSHAMCGQEAGWEIYSQRVFSGYRAAEGHVRKAKNIPEDGAQSAREEQSMEQLPGSWLDLGILPAPGDRPFGKSPPRKQWVRLARAHMHSFSICAFHQQENKHGATLVIFNFQRSIDF